MPKILNENFNYISDVLMPGEEGTFILDIKTAENKPTIDAITSGALPIRIHISCTDIFDNSFQVVQGIRKIGSSYKMTEYSQTK